MPLRGACCVPDSANVKAQMSVIKVRIYRDLGPHRRRELAPDALLKVISVTRESDKPMNKERAKRLLALVFPELGKVWYVWEHQDGWQKSIVYGQIKAWALVCKAE